LVVAKSAESARSAARRVARYRERLMISGTRRIEVVVPAQDAEAIRGLAAILRAGGEKAVQVRQRLAELLPTRMAQSGRDLVALFRASPLVGLELDLERDKSPGRDVDPWRDTK
jgi:hypothetical protein